MRLALNVPAFSHRRRVLVETPNRSATSLMVNVFNFGNYSLIWFCPTLRAEMGMFLAYEIKLGGVNRLPDKLLGVG